MSFPNIPDVSPAISITVEEAVNLLLASIAFEELGLAHIINAEAEKIQFVLGTLHDCSTDSTTATVTTQPPSIEDLIKIDTAVEGVLRTVIKQQMLLQFKLEDIISISTSSTTTSTTSTTESSTNNGG